MAAKPGLLETAAGGTLFLDEVGELPLATQAKLLRVIETREVTRLGSVRPRRIDVRFIAATNRELEAEVGRGSFRQDLYFRLNGITLTIPPLRTRVVEIPHLAETFARQICRDLGRPPPVLPPPVIELLEAYAWPGNIRELKNVVERAVLLSIGPDHRAASTCRSRSWRPDGARRGVEAGAPGRRPRRASTPRSWRRRPSARGSSRPWRPARGTRAGPPSCSDAAPDVREQARSLQDPAPQKEARRRHGELSASQNLEAQRDAEIDDRLVEQR